MPHKSTTVQLKLPLQFVPGKVIARGLVEAHKFPHVSAGKDRSGVYAPAFRVDASEAWSFPELEIGRTGNSYPALILDIDGSGALERLIFNVETDRIPAPSWSVERRGGGLHAAWCLRRPVLRGASARAKPLRLFRRCAEYLADVLGADPAYNGVLSHNPMSKAQGAEFRTNWGEPRQGYELGELAEIIPFGWKIPKVCRTSIGRNCAVFDSLMKWAGSPSNLTFEVLPAALAVNRAVDPPMPYVEVRGIARSVERYRADWKARGRFYTVEQRTLWGRALGVRSGASRRARNADRDAAIVETVQSGRSLRDVGREFGITEGSVRWVVRRGA